MDNGVLPPVTVAGSQPASALSVFGPASAAVSGGLSLLGGILGNRSAAKAAQENRDWQERMRATQYQTAVSDLKAAGLNPMLAYTQGGAGTPSGAVAKTENVVGPAANSALSTMQVVAGLENMQAQTGQTRMQTAATLEQINLLREQQDATSADTKRINATVDQLIAQLPGTKAQSAREVGTWQEDVKMRKAQRQLSEYAVPEARNMAGAQDSWFMKYVNPYLNSGRSAVDLMMKGGSALRGIK